MSSACSDNDIIIPLSQDDDFKRQGDQVNRFWIFDIGLKINRQRQGREKTIGPLVEYWKTGGVPLHRAAERYYSEAGHIK